MYNSIGDTIVPNYFCFQIRMGILTTDKHFFLTFCYATDTNVFNRNSM